MSIRLSKAIKECNVGLQTAVDFLNKKGSTEVEANLNTKISDEQYELLLKEFKPDSVLKDAANLMLQQQKEEKERKEKEKAEAKAKAKINAKEPTTTAKHTLTVAMIVINFFLPT